MNHASRFLLTALLFLPLFLNAQPLNPSVSAPKYPLETPFGILVTDENNGSLMLIREDGSRVLTETPGSGYQISLSRDRMWAGFKSINASGLQAPALLNLSTGDVFLLTQHQRQTGQPDVISQYEYAFTTETILTVRTPLQERMYELGEHINLVALRPGNDAVAFAKADGSVHILWLANGSTEQISSREGAYFRPRWNQNGSVLLYSGINGTAYMYDLASRTTVFAGELTEPVWSPDGQLVAGYTRTFDGETVTGTSIRIVSLSGKDIAVLQEDRTSEPVDPSFSADGSLIYSRLRDGHLLRWNTSSNSSAKEIFSQAVTVPIQYNDLQSTLPVETALEVPYVHQVYDTPDWFNGHSSCGATTAIMAIAYYKILPPWETVCATPYPHTNSWGMYVSEKYNFNGVSYTQSANDPNGRAAQGGFGFMWTGGYSPYSRMRTYYGNHKFTATQSDNPAYMDAVTEAQAGAPYSLCVALTTSGHIVLSHGLGANTGVLVTNDPYGNKNNPGYPNPSGKNAQYDWPGYNNGYKNLTTVYWAIKKRYTEPVYADTLVEEFHFAKGFYMHAKKPANMYLYREREVGHNGHQWWVSTTSSTNSDTCYVIWTPTIPQNGTYKVEAYIHNMNAQQARYKVNHRLGTSVVPLDQSGMQNTWLEIGNFEFNAGTSGSVRLGDGTGIRGQQMCFDAMRFTYMGPFTGVEESLNPSGFMLQQNYPNPFNPSTTINFTLAKQSLVKVSVYNQLGQCVAVLANEIFSAGTSSLRFDATGMPSGVYFLTAESAGNREVVKMNLLK